MSTIKLDKFFDDSFFKRHWTPAVNIYESDNSYEVEIAVPGMHKEDFKIKLDSGILTVSAESASSSKDRGIRYTRREFSYASFSRAFELPDNADGEDVQARYDNGILKLSIAKKTIQNIRKAIAVG